MMFVDIEDTIGFEQRPLELWLCLYRVLRGISTPDDKECVRTSM